jgi:glycosyltransferase involved in cell wall biosynthesis
LLKSSLLPDNRKLENMRLKYTLVAAKFLEIYFVSWYALTSYFTLPTTLVTRMTSLSIILPAYNEEEAIISSIRRAKASVEKIKKELSLDPIEIIVVNDGSSDKTLSLAQEERGITIITYPKNRGYGAALQTGFAYASGDLVGFLDADGTCDPDFFIDLCKPIIEDRADIVLGNRLTKSSEMPYVRKVGNILYAELLKFLAGRVVNDTASGMRVIRKATLPLLYPLPNGLDFTPAMSAKALLDPEIRIEEIHMVYKERIGKSKLNVVKDGIRFLSVILQTTFAYRPKLVYNVFTVACVLIALGYFISPLLYYIRFRGIEDYMYYRLSTITVLFIVAALTFNLGLINQRITMLRNRRILTDDSYFARYSGLFGFGLILAAVLLTHQGIFSYILTGKVYLHWVYILVGEFLSVLGLIFIFSKILYTTIKFIKIINIAHPHDTEGIRDFETTHSCKVITETRGG